MCIRDRAITIGVGRTIATADAEGVELVAVAVAVTSGDVRASAVVDLTGTVADPAGIQGTNAVVYVVAEAITVCIRSAGATAVAEGVKLVAIAITVPGRDVRASAFVDLAGTVADSTGVQGTDAVVDIVADSIIICIRSAGATADAEGVKLVAVAVTVAGRDPFAAADSARVEVQASCIGGIVIVAGGGVRTGVGRFAEAIAVDIALAGAILRHHPRRCSKGRRAEFHRDEHIRRVVRLRLRHGLEM